MTGSPRATDLATVEDFYALVPDGQKADLLDGVIYMASPDTYHGDQYTNFFSHLLHRYCEARDLGQVFGSRFAFRLSPHRAPEPDVAVVSTGRLHLVDDHGMTGGPDVAVEIVSRDSKTRDYRDKRRIYEESGVAEYWIVDPIRRRADFLVLEAGKYRSVELENGSIFRSRVLPGFSLDVSWLFGAHLPKVQPTLEQILRG
jgi:Uma2 family endonuclease